MNAWSYPGIITIWHSNQMHAFKCLWQWCKVDISIVGHRLPSFLHLSFVLSHFLFWCGSFCPELRKERDPEILFFLSLFSGRLLYLHTTLIFFPRREQRICNKCFRALPFTTSQLIKNYTVMCEALTKENNGVRDHWGAAESKTCKSKDTEMTGENVNERR